MSIEPCRHFLCFRFCFLSLDLGWWILIVTERITNTAFAYRLWYLDALLPGTTVRSIATDKPKDQAALFLSDWVFSETSESQESRYQRISGYRTFCWKLMAAGAKSNETCRFRTLSLSGSSTRHSIEKNEMFEKRRKCWLFLTWRRQVICTWQLVHFRHVDEYSLWIALRSG